MSLYIKISKISIQLFSIKLIITSQFLYLVTVTLNLKAVAKVIAFY